MQHVAQQIGCTAAEVEDVVTYYTMFYTRPVGTYVVNVCRTLSCALLGAERVTEELSAALGIKPGDWLAIGASMALQGDRLQNPVPLKIGSTIRCASPAIGELSHQVVAAGGIRR